jgi:hypothetical protein
MTDVTLTIRRSGALDGRCVPSIVLVHAKDRSEGGQLPAVTLPARRSPEGDHPRSAVRPVGNLQRHRPCGFGFNRVVYHFRASEL